MIAVTNEDPDSGQNQIPQTETSFVLIV